MSNFEVLVRTIDDIYDHPNADRLSIVKVLGYEAITAKRDDGSHRFEKGEAVVYVPEAAVLPEDVLKDFGFFDAEKGKGMLAGKAGNRVKAVRLRGVISQGLVFPLVYDGIAENGIMYFGQTITRGDFERIVRLGDDVAEFLGITKYEPPVPLGMGGEVAAVYDFAFDYDIENAQNYPGFLHDEEIEVTEKLHGTNFRVAYRPNVSHDEMFGELGNVAVSSKGLGKQGLVFKNNDANTGNLYVRTARELNLIEGIAAMGEELGKSIDLFGEIFGAGVQDLHYGTTKPEYRAFDIAVNGVYLNAAEKTEAFAKLGVERVPVLYTGPWDEVILVGHRDGKTTLSGTNIREGIVVTSTGDQTKRLANETSRLRPILKMVSPDYLLRKGEVTEFN